jgi:hypothetical protein
VGGEWVLDSGIEEEIVVKPGGRRPSILNWIGAILLFAVGYIHLALLVNMFGLAHMLGKLFLLNAIGAFVALILVLATPKWYGWVLGILVSGGAAFAKLGMRSIPGLGRFIMGGGAHFGPGPGHGGPGTKGGGPGGAGAHAGHFGPPVGHHILPLIGNMRTLGPDSVVIEIVFVVVAVIALIFAGRRAA